MSRANAHDDGRVLPASAAAHRAPSRAPRLVLGSAAVVTNAVMMMGLDGLTQRRTN